VILVWILVMHLLIVGSGMCSERLLVAYAYGKKQSSGLALMSFLWVGLACAQENRDDSQTPVNLRPFQLTLPRDHLFGDWYGMRAKLEETGFTPT